jgi:hypothetical protein
MKNKEEREGGTIDQERRDTRYEGEEEVCGDACVRRSIGFQSSILVFVL